MRISILFYFLILFLTACTTMPSQTTQVDASLMRVAQRDAAAIGQRIWMNEGAGKVENLTVWNQGEEFPSLGIGHFIWYPTGYRGGFIDAFPELLIYMKERGARLPTWLQTIPPAPWTSREQFYANFNSPKMVELRGFLHANIPLQVEFMLRRLEQALPKMLASLPTQAKRDHIRTQFYRVGQHPHGVYTLIDYVNFKGEGVATTERYNSHGWGLLQVLENMRGNTNNPHNEFSDAAFFVLQRRVQNSPPQRGESRWLNGWKNRVDTYRM